MYADRVWGMSYAGSTYRRYQGSPTRDQLNASQVGILENGQKSRTGRPPMRRSAPLQAGERRRALDPTKQTVLR